MNLYSRTLFKGTGARAKRFALLMVDFWEWCGQERNHACETMIRSLVDSAADILFDPKAPLRELGALMHQSWRIKR